VAVASEDAVADFVQRCLAAVGTLGALAGLTGLIREAEAGPLRGAFAAVLIVLYRPIGARLAPPVHLFCLSMAPLSRLVCLSFAATASLYDGSGERAAAAIASHWTRSRLPSRVNAIGNRLLECDRCFEAAARPCSPARVRRMHCFRA
jgi:hypothetical protein